MQQLEDEGSTKFTKDLRNLSKGPEKLVTRHTGCVINGFRFHTQDRD